MLGALALPPRDHTHLQALWSEEGHQGESCSQASTLSSPWQREPQKWIFFQLWEEARFSCAQTVGGPQRDLSLKITKCPKQRVLCVCVYRVPGLVQKSQA